MNLEECRVKIDEIDSQLLGLIEDRMEVVKEISRNKAIAGMPVLDETREQAKLEKVRELSQYCYEDYNAEMFEAVMAVSRKYQKEHPVCYGLLGEHLGHSFSPEIHRALGGYDYYLFEIEPDKLENFLKKSSVRGLNVTIPYKKAVIPYLDKLSRVAEELGSVNCIVREAGGELVGYNTDYYGFTKMVKNSQVDVSGAKCIVLGDGGVAPTVRLALKDMGAGEVVTISRRGEFNYTNLELHADAEIIVNTTPVGMYPGNGAAAVDVADFPKCRGVIDLIYNPLKTKLMLDAEAKGIPVTCGLDMLVYQAAKAVKLFTGQEVSGEAVESFLESMKKKERNIVLIGMPGCGKSRIGMALAEKLGMKYADADTEIQIREEVSPGDIIREQGEPAFRAIETEILRELGAGHGTVIATGGGAVTVPENYQLLAQNGIIVYVNRPVADLSTAGRPLSQTHTPQVLYLKRKDLYETWMDLEAEVLENPQASAAAIAEKLCSI